MYRLKLFVTGLLVVTIAFICCIKAQDVYVVGSDSEFGTLLWKNNESQSIIRDLDSIFCWNTVYISEQAHSVCVFGSDVYIAGYQFKQIKDTLIRGRERREEENLRHIYIAKIWKNGVAQNLTGGAYEAMAHSIFVYGNDVYVAGYEKNAQGKKVAKLWINEKAKDLSDGREDAEAKSVYVVDNNIYVAGYGNGGKIAILWENEVAQNLIEGRFPMGTEARSVYVSGNDVYVAGVTKSEGYRDVAKLWKNGVVQILEGENIDASSVYVSDSDVYVVGVEAAAYRPVAKLWKNGVLQNIDNGTYRGTYARSVFVYGSDVYIAGVANGKTYDTTFALLWKNGILQELSDGNGYGFANCVFVK